MQGQPAHFALTEFSSTFIAEFWRLIVAWGSIISPFANLIHSYTRFTPGDLPDPIAFNEATKHHGNISGDVVVRFEGEGRKRIAVFTIACTGGVDLARRFQPILTALLILHLTQLGHHVISSQFIRMGKQSVIELRI